MVAQDCTLEVVNMNRYWLVKLVALLGLFLLSACTAPASAAAVPIPEPKPQLIEFYSPM
jgi:uncharacterized lipoprotein YajG